MHSRGGSGETVGPFPVLSSHVSEGLLGEAPAAVCMVIAKSLLLVAAGFLFTKTHPSGRSPCDLDGVFGGVNSTHCALALDGTPGALRSMHSMPCDQRTGCQTNHGFKMTRRPHTCLRRQEELPHLAAMQHTAAGGSARTDAPLHHFSPPPPCTPCHGMLLPPSPPLLPQAI